MAQLKKIVRFLDTYLRIDEVSDSSWNGLQVEGKQEVQSIICAVDAGKATFERALQDRAEMIIVHHGHFWKPMNPSLTGWKKERLSLLGKNKISLYACHLPLDRHEVVGNNAQLLKLLGAKITDEFFYHEGKNLGWLGRFIRRRSLREIQEVLEKALDTRCMVLGFGPQRIRTIAVCSGGGDYRTFYEALERGVDLYITGEASDVYHTAKDAGMNVIFAGHHATETLGVKALCPLLEKKFKVKAAFVDIPTGL